MTKLFIMHCPVTCGERRPGLEKHLKDRGFMDVEWITDYSTDHSYVRWLHKRLGEKASLAHISGLIKGLEMFRKVARDTSNTKWFWKGDDDIRFIKHWDKVQHVPDERLMYVNLSIGVNFGILPDGKPRLIGNNGGAEVFCFTREFAQLFLDNIDIRQSGDILIHAFMNHIGHPLVCVPIAHQTSLLETKTSSLVIDNKLTPWIDFLKNFKPTGVRYEDLRNESGFFTRDDA
jgi:hypothetical protein